MASTAPYGLWPSPLAPEQLARGKRLEDVAWDSNRLAWLEGRSGQGVVVALDEGELAPRDLTGERSVRARVGYGGGDFGVADGQLVFASGERLYVQPMSVGAAKPITPEYGAWAAPTISPCGRWAVVVHSDERRDCLALVDLSGEAWPVKVASGADFYMQPAWHPQGAWLAWVEWDHPQMPWDGTRLMLAAVEWGADGMPRLREPQVVAGSVDVAVQQPQFSPDGAWLAYLSDQTGCLGLYALELTTREVRPLVQEQAELGGPTWAQGMRSYGWDPAGDRLHYVRSQEGRSTLWQVSCATGERREHTGLAAYTHLAQPAVAADGRIALLASSARLTERVIVYSPQTGTHQVVARASGETLDPAWLSEPEPITWPTEDGSLVHGLLYRPAPAMRGVGKPPLIVHVHGGPTGQATMAYSSQVQFFASRGYAVLAVNYRGSAGYGRQYMTSLREQWGVYDVQDTAAGARYLAEQGLVDPGRMVVMGGSAGGLTVLASLIAYPRLFKAGICLYGVTNLFTLAADTHKFEEHYLDSMIGPLPETAARYRERSPLFHAERIQDPVAIFQGDSDPVVPPSQAETVVAALRRAGTPCEYHVFAGEGHGWRKAETIEAFYRLVLQFLKQYVLYA